MLKFCLAGETFKNAPHHPAAGRRQGERRFRQGQEQGWLLSGPIGWNSIATSGLTPAIPAGDIGVGGRGWRTWYDEAPAAPVRLHRQGLSDWRQPHFAWGYQLQPAATSWSHAGHRGQPLAACGSRCRAPGNVVQYAIEKAIALGARVITASDSAAPSMIRTASPREAGPV